MKIAFIEITHGVIAVGNLLPEHGTMNIIIMKIYSPPSQIYILLRLCTHILMLSETTF